MAKNGEFESFLNSWRPRIDERLAVLLKKINDLPGCPEPLAQAMEHSLLGPGKRLRPLLCLAAIRAGGGDERAGLDAACSLEFVHAYSLVHDDLPAMDDDDVRRGRPTCHKLFGEALAILAGDALLTHAFEVLVESLDDSLAARAVAIVARAAGGAGMVGGQVDDVEPNPEGGARESAVISIHRRKTAMPMEAALLLGGLMAGATEDEQQALGQYGLALGMAFQIADDLLALEKDQQTLGRPTTADEEHNRRTYPLAVGASKARARAEQYLVEARAAVARFEERADVLLGLADLVAGRAGPSAG